MSSQEFQITDRVDDGLAQLKGEALSEIHKILKEEDLGGSSELDRGDYQDLVQRTFEGHFDEMHHDLPSLLQEDNDKFKEFLRGVVVDIAEGLKTDDGISNRESGQALSSGPASKPYHERVWDKLLARAAEMKIHGERPYEGFIQRHGRDELFNRLRAGVDAFVWDNFVEGDKGLDPEFIHGLEEDFYQCGEPGFYLIFVYNEDEKRGGREVPSDGHLPRKVKIFKLGIQKLGLPDNGDELFANIGEMYFALIFLSLQIDDLKLWLPEDAPLDQLARGLNVALPLHQSWADMAKHGMAKYLKSPDPEVVAYALSVLANNRAKVVQDKYRQNMVSLRNMGKWSDLFREGRPGETIDTKCSKCGWQSVDHFPRWVLRTDEYVARLQGCQQCPLGVRDTKTKRKYASTTFVPLKASMRFIVASTFYSRIEKRPAKEKWRQWYAFESDVRPGVG